MPIGTKKGDDLQTKALPRKSRSGESARSGRADGHCKAKALESANEGSLQLFGVSAIEVVGAKVSIRLLILDHVEYDHQNVWSTATMARFFLLRSPSGETVPTNSYSWYARPPKPPDRDCASARCCRCGFSAQSLAGTLVVSPGEAPGFVSGLLELHARVPGTAAVGDALPIDLVVGSTTSQP